MTGLRSLNTVFKSLCVPPGDSVPFHCDIIQSEISTSLFGLATMREVDAIIDVGNQALSAIAMLHTCSKVRLAPIEASLLSWTCRTNGVMVWRHITCTPVVVVPQIRLWNRDKIKQLNLHFGGDGTKWVRSGGVGIANTTFASRQRGSKILNACLNKQKRGAAFIKAAQVIFTAGIHSTPRRAVFSYTKSPLGVRWTGCPL